MSTKTTTKPFETVRAENDHLRLRPEDTLATFIERAGRDVQRQRDALEFDLEWHPDGALQGALDNVTDDVYPAARDLFGVERREFQGFLRLHVVGMDNAQ